MSLLSEVTQLGSSALSWGSDKIDQFTNFVSGTVNEVTSTVGSLIVGSVVGINANKVPEMVQSIETAVQSISTHLDEVNTNTDPSVAFADPGMQEACRAYIKGVMEACQAYTSQLLKLADTLEDIKATYEQNQQAQNETLQAAGTEAASSVEKYTRGAAGGRN